ncbi:MAG TPA: hypothetical protein VFT50_10425 [Baekduia sp.]|nr:hypothetical protein [Baekduia sp.]
MQEQLAGAHVEDVPAGDGDAELVLDQALHVAQRGHQRGRPLRHLAGVEAVQADRLTGARRGTAELAAVGDLRLVPPHGHGLHGVPPEDPVWVGGRGAIAVPAS